MKFENKENEIIKNAFQGFEVPENYFDSLEKNILNKTINKRKIVNKKILSYSLISLSLIAISLIVFFKSSTNNKIDFQNLKSNYHLHILYNDPNLFLLDKKNNILYINIDSSEHSILQAIEDIDIPEKDKYNLLMSYKLLKYSLSEYRNNKLEILEYEQIDEANNKKYKYFDTINSSKLFNIPREICSEKPIVLEPSIANKDAYQYKWSNGETSDKIYITESGTYTLTITPIKSEDPKVLLATTKVLIIPPPKDLSPKTILGCVGSEVELDLNIDTSKYNIEWINLRKKSKSIKVTKPGTYIAKITGCQTYLDSFIVSFTHCDIKIPNAITPNGDGVNDVFYITNIENYPNTQLFIYSNDGNLIYHNKNYQNDWDASNTPPGTYFYKIIFPDKIIQNGTLLIIK